MALLRVYGWRRLASIGKPMQSSCKFLRASTERRIEENLVPAPLPPVEQRASGDSSVEHFFKAERLCAQLNLVALIGFWTSALVLDGEGLPGAFCTFERDSPRSSVEFNNVGNAAESPTQGMDSQSASNAQIAARLALSSVSRFVKNSALRRQPIFGPKLFEVNQRPLALAKHEVLKR